MNPARLFQRSYLIQQHQQRNRNQQPQNPEDVVTHGGEHFPPELAYRIRAQTHLGYRVRRSENKAVYKLASVYKNQHNRKHNTGREHPPSREKAHQKGDQKGKPRRKAQSKPEVSPEITVHTRVNQGLPIEHGEKPIHCQAPFLKTVSDPGLCFLRMGEVFTAGGLLFYRFLRGRLPGFFTGHTAEKGCD